MELPDALKLKLRILGILPWPNSYNIPLDYLLILLMFATLVDSLTFTFWFVMWDATSLNDMAQSGLFVVVNVFYLMIYIRVIWRRKEFKAIIEEIEDRIKTRNLHIFWTFFSPISYYYIIRGGSNNTLTIRRHANYNHQIP